MTNNNPSLRNRLLLSLVPGVFLIAIPTVQMLVGSQFNIFQHGNINTVIYFALFAAAVLFPSLNAESHRSSKMLALIVATPLVAGLTGFLAAYAINTYSINLALTYSLITLLVTVISLLIAVIFTIIGRLRTIGRLLVHVTIAGALSGLLIVIYVDVFWCLLWCKWWEDLPLVAPFIFWQLTYCSALYYGMEQLAPTEN
jgi:hypothetical protein